MVIARKRAGAGWSAPVKVGVGPDSVTVYVGVDGAGNVTATWSTGNGGPLDPSVTSIATWLATSATPTVEVLNTALLDTPEPVYVNDLAVSPAGHAVLAGLAGDYDMVLGYRASPTGTWAYNQKFGVQGSQPLQDPHVAINDTGNAVASYHTSSSILASRRNAFADWGAVEFVASAGSTESRSVAIDPPATRTSRSPSASSPARSVPARRSALLAGTGRSRSRSARTPHRSSRATSRSP